MFPEIATVESEGSRRGVTYFGPGDNITSTLTNLGKRQHSVKVGRLLRQANVHTVFTDGLRPRRVLHS